MSDDGNDDPSLMSENGDGPSLSIHDEKDDQLLPLGIYCDAEFHLQDLKEALKQYAHARNFQATLTQRVHASIHPIASLTHHNFHSITNRMTCICRFEEKKR